MKIPDSLLLNNKEHTIFQRLSCLFFIYVFPLVLADVLYKDDMKRVLYSDPSSWYDDGRPLMAFILSLFNFGTPMFDTSPLPLLIGILFLAFSLTLFYKKYLQNYDRLSVVLCLLMFIISPFFLENLSFKFESLGMSITLGLYLILFSLPDHIGKTFALVISIIVTVCVSCIYQATLGAFFSLLFLTVFLELEEIPLKNSLEKAFYKLVGFCIGFFFYIFCIAPHYVAKTGYQAEHSGLISLTSAGIDKFISNLKSFFTYLKWFYFPNDNPFVTFLTTAVLLVTLVAIIMYVKILLSKENDSAKYSKAFLGLVIPVFIIVFAFIPMCFLSNPNFMPRAFISFNVFLLFAGIMIISLSKKNRLALLILIPIFLFSYSFSYTYANLLKSQVDYENHIAQTIVYDLNKIDGINGSYRFFIEGKRLVAKDVALATKRYRIFELMIPNLLRRDYVFTGHLLSRYSTYRIEVNTLKKYNPNDYKVVTKNTLYRILQKNKDVVIEFLAK